MNRSLLVGSGFVAGAAMLFGSLGYLSRMADAAGIGAFAFVFWRGALATLFLVGLTLLLFARGRIGLPDLRLLNRRQQVALGLACLCGAVLNIAMFVAFLRTEIAVVLITFYVFPAIVTLAAVRLYGERLDLARSAALVLASAGLVLVLLAPLLQTGRLELDLIGVGLALLAAVCQATFLLISGRGFRPLKPLHVSTYVILAAAALSLPLALAFDPGALVLPFTAAETWPWLLAGGIVGAAIPTTLLLTGMGVIGPSRAAILMTFEPVVGVALAGLLLGEQPGPLQIAGGAMVLIAAVVLQAGPRAPVHAAMPEDTGEYQQVV